MFCANCGEKIKDGMKFCPNCGVDIRKIFEDMQDDMQDNMPISADLGKNKSMITKEELMEKMFWNVFKIRGKFGPRVYFIGKDIFPQKYEDNLKKYLGSYIRNEKVLLIFVYPDSNFEDGFIITNQRLIWHNGGYDTCEILLEDIKEVRIGKSILATVMNIVSYDNEIYPKIYLTGINSEEEFVLKFRSFIYDIQKFRKNGSEKISNLEETKKEDTVDCIINSCNSVKIDSIYCIVGNPKVSYSSKKYTTAKAYFDIPDDEDIYLIYDETIMGGCKKGFALCTTGFYYCKQQSGYIPWNEFKNLKVRKSMGEIIVGSEEFNTAGDSKQILMILLNIQELLKKGV